MNETQIIAQFGFSMKQAGEALLRLGKLIPELKQPKTPWYKHNKHTYGKGAIHK